MIRQIVRKALWPSKLSNSPLATAIFMASSTSCSISSRSPSARVSVAQNMHSIGLSCERRSSVAGLGEMSSPNNPVDGRSQKHSASSD